MWCENCCCSTSDLLNKSAAELRTHLEGLKKVDDVDRHLHAEPGGIPEMSRERFDVYMDEYHRRGVPPPP